MLSVYRISSFPLFFCDFWVFVNYAKEREKRIETAMEEQPSMSMSYDDEDVPVACPPEWTNESISTPLAVTSPFPSLPSLPASCRLMLISLAVKRKTSFTSRFPLSASLPRCTFNAMIDACT